MLLNPQEDADKASASVRMCEKKAEERRGRTLTGARERREATLPEVIALGSDEGGNRLSGSRSERNENGEVSLVGELDNSVCEES